MTSSAEEKKQSDFRYETGNAAVPWRAVGEPVTSDDITRLVEFLIQPVAGKSEAYQKQLVTVRAAIEALAAEGEYAGKLSLGQNVKALETRVAEMLDVKHACFLASWTGGMEIALRLAGLRPGDEVIIPSNTFVATMLWPLSIGAKVVFADIDQRTVNIDPSDVGRKITPKTRAIMPVHIGGYPADMDPIMALARKHDIMVIEDAAHAFGALYKGRKIGTIGDFGGFSFHEVKNITSLGEGGLLVSNSDLGKQFAKARFCSLDFTRQVKNWLYDVTALRDRFGNPVAPCNYSVTEAQAVVLLNQLVRFEQILGRRREAFRYLCQRFGEAPEIVLPPGDTDEIRSTHHLFLLQVNPKMILGDVQDLKAKLKSRGVTEIQHFAPMYKFEIIRELGYDQAAIAETCPNTEQVFGHKYTHLPLYGLTRPQLEYMAEAVLAAVRELKEGK
jgi:dTDP-4-amino-4,6-dideoxygalactose transaminase